MDEEIFNYNFELYEKELKNKVSEKRFVHSVNVSKMAEKLAKIYGENVEKAKVAGLLHDIVKEMTTEEHLKLLKDSTENLEKFENVSPKILHGPAGSEYIKIHFNIKDEDVLNAVRYHTTGRKNMTLFEKIIFVSDHISEERDWPDVVYLQNLAKTDLNKVVFAKLYTSIKKCINNKQGIHIDTVESYNQVLNEIN